MRTISTILGLFLITSLASADIHMPVEQTVYDKLGRGVANIVFAMDEIPDSWYNVTQAEGSSEGATKGVVQGFSRMLMDMGLGAFEVVTFPIVTEKPLKAPAYDTTQDNVYPPTLLDNWY